MNKAKGLLYGGALGDALGAPHEFMYQKDDAYTGRLQYPLKYRRRFMKSGEMKIGVIGQITDDTEMELCILHSLVENKGKIVRDSLVKNYLKWANDKDTVFMGINTRTLFTGVTTIKGYETRYAKISDPEASQSNGCLMRAGILAVSEKISGTDALVDCRITNPSGTCLEVVRLYIDIIKYALDGRSKSFIHDYISKVQINSDSIKKCISDVLSSNKRYIAGKDKGWVVHGLYCALWSLLCFDTYHAGINAVIKLGGDTDTNASIAGDLLGAFYGYDTIMEDPVTSANMKIMLTADTSGSDLRRHKIYEISCAEPLLVALVGMLQ
jgi:ADP-ribosylglycohydrolase